MLRNYMYVAQTLTLLLRLGTFSWIVTRDSHAQKFLNSQPWLRPTRLRSAAHRLRTAALQCPHCVVGEA